jgi:hypothetical protein
LLSRVPPRRWHARSRYRHCVQENLGTAVQIPGCRQSVPSIPARRASWQYPGHSRSCRRHPPPPPPRPQKSHGQVWRQREGREREPVMLACTAQSTRRP